MPGLFTNRNNSGDSRNKSPFLKSGRSIYWMYAAIFVALFAIYFMGDNTRTQEVSWTDFQTWVAKGGMERIVVSTGSNEAEGFMSDSLARAFYGKSY